MLYALGQPKLTFRAHCVLAPALFVFPVIGLQLYGLRGSVIGYIAAFWMTVPLWFVLVRRAAYQEKKTVTRAKAMARVIAENTDKAAGKDDVLIGRHRRRGRRIS
jgi:hypothetical protein